MKKILFALTCAILVTLACGTSSVAAPTLYPTELQTVIAGTALAAQDQTRSANVPTDTLVSNSPPIPSITTVPINSHPQGTSGQCADRTYTSAENQSGACSHHGGVATWWGSAISQNPAGASDTPAAVIVTSGDAAYLPNPVSQPGADNPDVTQANIQLTICVSGYTSKIRPPAEYTDKLKVQQIQQYGYTDTNPKDYEEDHLISLEIGGNPTDPKNLWPEPRHTTPYNASTKDTLENRLHELVCSGQISLDTARQAIATDWVAAYRQYVSQSIISATGVPTEP